MLIDGNFWKRFAKSTWEKKPVVVRNVRTPLLEMDSRQIFLSLVSYCDTARKLKDPTGLKFYVSGHRQLDTALLRLLPKSSDRSLAGYHERMEQLFPDYCLVCDELLQVNHAQHSKLVEFTSALYREVGFPNRFTEMGLYLGNYRKTPFGVHVDGCGVFSFPIVGQKSFRIWKPAYVAKNPGLARSFRYAKHAAASQVLTAATGDMTYWPSTAWHIAESNGRFSATWSLGVWIDQTHLSDVTTIVSDVIAHHSHQRSNDGTTHFVNLNLANGEVRSLPKSYEVSLELLRKLSPTKMRSEFLKAWLVHTSKQGFKISPLAATSSQRSAGSSFKLKNLKAPIRWFFSKDERLYFYSYNGALTQGSNSKKFLNLIKSLNAGATVPRAAAVKLRSALSKRELAALDQLNGAGAFE